jgi:hypothetical protein
MAKVKKNMMLKGLSGSIGPDHYARVTKNGKTIISHKPDFGNRQFSEAQLNHQSGMKTAAAYAKVASKDNPIYTKKAAGTSKNAYNLALKDWFKAPEIDSMDWQNGLIRVSATDNVQVTKVVITVLDHDGQSLEQGEAELVMGVWWDYRAVNKGRIQVEAWDFAGNVTCREFEDPTVFIPFPKKAA